MWFHVFAELPQQADVAIILVSVLPRAVTWAERVVLEVRHPPENILAMSTLFV
jgi:hypothetical protein